jgi:hypothetical protein
LAEVIGLLVNKVTEDLKLGSHSEPWNPADEAGRYFEEAQYAYGWGRNKEAQAAAEASWALGRRTKDVAALRICAYSDDVWPINEFSDNIEIPAVPDAAKFGPLMRALELFLQDKRLFFTNTTSTSLDEGWFLIGLQTFRRGAAALDGFYHAAELREGNETQLARLRSLTRESDSKKTANWLIRLIRIMGNFVPQQQSQRLSGWPAIKA